MEKSAKMLLFAIYSSTKRPNLEIQLSSTELLWARLQNNKSLFENWGWSSISVTDIPQSQEKHNNPFDHFETLENDLAYLKEAGFLLKNEKHGITDPKYTLSISVKGHDFAKKYRSMLGRIDLQYREQKGGIAGLLLTVIVAVITSLLTTCVSQQQG